MTLLATREECGCEEDFYQGQKRPEKCPHGNRYLSEAQLNPKRRKRATTTSKPKRDWSAAIAKVESEVCCRVCGSTSHVEAAHIMGRKHDEPVHPGSRVRYVDPNRIVPLCGPFPDGCHGDFDHKRLDLLKHLRPEEQTQAVADAGSIESARRRLLPSAYREAGVTA